MGLARSCSSKLQFRLTLILLEKRWPRPLLSFTGIIRELPCQIHRYKQNSSSDNGRPAAQATLYCSRTRRRYSCFPAQDSGGRRQFHLFWWQALGGIFAKEHSNVFFYEPGGVISSQDHACFEAQRRI